MANQQGEPALDRDAEHQLIETAQRDPEALAQLYRRYYQAIAGYVQARVGRSSVAEDLVADVFLAMVRYLPRYRIGPTPFRAWLYRLATNRVNRWARWQRRHACKELHDVAAPAEGDARAEQAARVRSALLTLPSRFQNVLSLHYLEGMSIATIAQVLDCPEGTVKSQLSRGRALLRAILLETGHES